MTFGQRLKQLREAAGMTQEALARAANLALSTVAKMETRSIDPEWSTVRRLANALGVSCSAFELPEPPASEASGESARPEKKSGRRGCRPRRPD
jgi:transcriptional regulator with XRE-family HTH domain